VTGAMTELDSNDSAEVGSAACAKEGGTIMVPMMTIGTNMNVLL
jgi:hypothetical protein